ncbi:MAG: ribosome-associated translation inhibitor RaiA [Muribaculaceae bacterium]|nr:ribosome-associated translation inhibitor RaiA [Muribaculaceae bacterium]
MDVRIQAIHFEIADRLVDFINKKADRLARRFPTISTIDANLKVVKPETAMNKEVVLRITTPQAADIVATKLADSFEEAVDLAIEAAERQLEKTKEKK